MLTMTGGREAKVRYLQGAFQLQVPGDFVICAITGLRIPLGDLRYWNEARQEAYFSAEAATKAYEQHVRR
jgi:hypothetical protein